VKLVTKKEHISISFFQMHFGNDYELFVLTTWFSWHKVQSVFLQQ